MSHAKAFVGCLGFAVFVAAGVACSADGSASFLGGDRNESGTDAGNAGTTAPNAAGDAFGVAATGIVLVHAAASPSFRLCFGNRMELPPQPDTEIMPESNVVGVETGSFVRLPAMDAPGKIYVIDERKVRGRTESCAQLVDGKNGQSALLASGNDYDTVLGSLDDDLGKTGVDVVALTGCANALTLRGLKVDPSTCGDGFQTLEGNLRAKVLRLQPTRTGATGSKLPVQLYQLSTAIDTLAGKGSLQVSFGALPAAAGLLGQPLDVRELYAAGLPTMLDFDQTSEAVYGTHGFRIAVGPRASAVTVDQSLATVQDLSSSNELPTSYYGAASNYALLLLGDPAYPADAGAASVRFGMHLLAVPVIDPATADAGADAAADGGN